MNKWKFSSGLAVGLWVAAAGGCDQKQMAGDEFLPEDAPTRSVHQFADVHAAVGARTDAMLRPMHFDGNSLNSLGRSKLELMLKDSEAALPLSVYVNVPEDLRAKPRREAVLLYLKESGLLAAQYKVEMGVNPEGGGQTTAGLNALSKLDAVPGAAPGAAKGGAPAGGAAGETK